MKCLQEKQERELEFLETLSSDSKLLLDFDKYLLGEFREQLYTRRIRFNSKTCNSKYRVIRTKRKYAHIQAASQRCIIIGSCKYPS